jgi:hypothetical protein
VFCRKDADYERELAMLLKGGVMSFLIALGFVVGFVAGVISIYEFSKSRSRPGSILFGLDPEKYGR